MTLDTMVLGPEMTTQEFEQEMGLNEMTLDQFEASMQGEVTPYQPDLSRKVKKFYNGLAKEKKIKRLLEENPEYQQKLEAHVQKTFDKYQSNLEATSTKLNTALKALGTAGDAYFFYDPIGGLGIKFISTVARTAVELPNAIKYTIKARDPLMFAGWAVMKAASYLPLLTLVDGGMKGIVRDRIYKEARKEFLKEVTEPKPSLFSKLYNGAKDTINKAKQAYNSIADKVKEELTPTQDYQPALSF